VDNLIVKTVPVKLELTGTLPEGYEVMAESMVSTITLEGAARYIEPTVRAVATVDMTGRTENVEESVNVVFYDKDDNEVAVVTRSQNTPNVTVRVTVSAYKLVNIHPEVTLEDDIYYTSINQVSPASVVIYGNSETLAAIDAVSTQSLVLPAERGVVTRDLALVLPEGVSLKRGQSSSVTLNAVVTEKTGETTLEAPLIYAGLGNDLVIADGAPTFMTLTVSGPLKQVEQVTPESLTVKVDLAGYGPGEWELIPVIQGLDLNRFPNVTVTLQEQRVRVTLTAPAAEESEPQAETAENP